MEDPASDMQLKPVRFAPLCCMGCFNIQNSTPRKNTSYVSATNKQFSTVIECIYQSQKLAESCNMKYVHVTADCGAACKFYQVTWNNVEKFKNVIIHLGDFHAMQELFGIIGKIVTGSGFEDVLYQAELCSLGGIKGVLSGKHYNRAWKVHEWFSESLHRLLLERESESLTISTELADLIKKVNDRNSCQKLSEHEDFTNFIEQFQVIKNQYLSRKG